MACNCWLELQDVQGLPPKFSCAILEVLVRTPRLLTTVRRKYATEPFQLKAARGVTLEWVQGKGAKAFARLRVLPGPPCVESEGGRDVGDVAMTDAAAAAAMAAEWGGSRVCKSEAVPLQQQLQPGEQQPQATRLTLALPLAQDACGGVAGCSSDNEDVAAGPTVAEVDLLLRVAPAAASGAAPGAPAAAAANGPAATSPTVLGSGALQAWMEPSETPPPPQQQQQAAPRKRSWLLALGLGRQTHTGSNNSSSTGGALGDVGSCGGGAGAGEMALPYVAGRPTQDSGRGRDGGPGIRGNYTTAAAAPIRGISAGVASTAIGGGGDVGGSSHCGAGAGGSGGGVPQGDPEGSLSGGSRRTGGMWEHAAYLARAATSSVSSLGMGPEVLVQSSRAYASLAFAQQAPEPAGASRDACTDPWVAPAPQPPPGVGRIPANLPNALSPRSEAPAAASLAAAPPQRAPTAVGESLSGRSLAQSGDCAAVAAGPQQTAAAPPTVGMVPSSCSEQQPQAPKRRRLGEFLARLFNPSGSFHSPRRTAAGGPDPSSSNSCPVMAPPNSNASCPAAAATATTTPGSFAAGTGTSTSAVSAPALGRSTSGPWVSSGRRNGSPTGITPLVPPSPRLGDVYRMQADNVLASDNAVQLGFTGAASGAAAAASVRPPSRPPSISLLPALLPGLDSPGYGEFSPAGGPDRLTVYPPVEDLAAASLATPMSTSPVSPAGGCFPWRYNSTATRAKTAAAGAGLSTGAAASCEVSAAGTGWKAGQVAACGSAAGGGWEALPGQSGGGPWQPRAATSPVVTGPAAPSAALTVGAGSEGGAARSDATLGRGVASAHVQAGKQQPVPPPPQASPQPRLQSQSQTPLLPEPQPHLQSHSQTSQQQPSQQQQQQQPMSRPQQQQQQTTPPAERRLQAQGSDLGKHSGGTSSCWYAPLESEIGRVMAFISGQTGTDDELQATSLSQCQFLLECLHNPDTCWLVGDSLLQLKFEIGFPFDTGVPIPGAHDWFRLMLPPPLQLPPPPTPPLPSNTQLQQPGYDVSDTASGAVLGSCPAATAAAAAEVLKVRWATIDQRQVGGTNACAAIALEVAAWCLAAVQRWRAASGGGGGSGGGGSRCDSGSNLRVTATSAAAAATAGAVAGPDPHACDGGSSLSSGGGGGRRRDLSQSPVRPRSQRERMGGLSRDMDSMSGADLGRCIHTGTEVWQGVLVQSPAARVASSTGDFDLEHMLQLGGYTQRLRLADYTAATLLEGAAGAVGGGGGGAGRGRGSGAMHRFGREDGGLHTRSAAAGEEAAADCSGGPDVSPQSHPQADGVQQLHGSPCERQRQQQQSPACGPSRPALVVQVPDGVGEGLVIVGTRVCGGETSGVQPRTRRASQCGVPAFSSVVRGLTQGVYVLGWHGHFATLWVRPGGVLHLIDSLGARLAADCPLAFVLEFSDAPAFLAFFGARHAVRRGDFVAAAGGGGGAGGEAGAGAVALDDIAGANLAALMEVHRLELAATATTLHARH